MLLGYQYPVTIASSGSNIIQYNKLLLLVTIQPHPRIVIHDGICLTNGQA